MAKEDGLTQQAKIKKMIEELGWEANLNDCAKYLQDKFNLKMDNAYISQLRSGERKRQGLPALRARKGGKRKVGRPAKISSPDAPATAPAKVKGTASATEITKFVLELTKWQERIGTAAIQEVLTTISAK